MAIDRRGLEAKDLRRRCDPAELGFETTADVPGGPSVVGQERAVAAIRFGIGIAREGYNIFALGPPGTGKQFLVTELLNERIAGAPRPPDCCYVYNFEDANRPRAMCLPAGRAVQFRDDMARLVDELPPAVVTALESEEYRTRRQAIDEELKARQEAALADLDQRARTQGLALIRSPLGLVLAPVRNGEVLSPDEFRKIPEPERKKTEKDLEALQDDLQKIVRRMPRLEHEAREKVRELMREMIGFAVGHLIAEMREKHGDLPEVVTYLDAVHRDLIENAGHVLLGPEEPHVHAPRGTPGAEAGPDASWFRRYRVNVIVDHGGSEGPPIVYEDHPTFPNLVGRVEHIAQMGALVTDFNLIKPGALHRANGGYLILDAWEVLVQPFAWDALKRALQSRQIRIESVGQMLSLISTVSLEPEPIPLDLKLVLLGDRHLYYLLCALDPEFGKLFKVAADFDDDVDRSREAEAVYASLVARLVRQEGLRPFDRGAVARVIEQSSRWSGDSEKLLTRMQNLVDLLRETDYWTGQDGRDVAGEDDVARAIREQIARSDRLRRRDLEEIRRGTVLVDTDGMRAGQVNGLSVVPLGDFTFGRPNRITARARLGKGEIVDIEREVKLGGPIHSKGVLILSGFLGGRYARERPLSLSASLVFEQSYGGVEGDSASAAELFALLSAIGEIPLDQSLAVTGSVNQHGEIQAVGGINEKIEGFFDACRERELTGRQGVLIPVSNVKHLMLREDVVAAVAEGRFHVWPFSSVDEGMELLTGLAAGERNAEGKYPPGSVNGRVEARLVEMAGIWERLAAASKKEA